MEVNEVLKRKTVERAGYISGITLKFKKAIANKIVFIKKVALLIQSKNIPYRLPNGITDAVQGQVIFVAAKRIFDLLCNQLQTREHIKNKGGDRYRPVTEGKYQSDRQRHDEKENKLLQKH